MRTKYEVQKWVLVMPYDVSTLGHGVDKIVWLVFIMNAFLIASVTWFKFKHQDPSSFLKVFISASSVVFISSAPSTTPKTKKSFFIHLLGALLSQFSQLLYGTIHWFIVSPTVNDVITE